jgi:hypothetical protein
MPYTVAGIVLALAGAVILSWRPLLGKPFTMGIMSGTSGRTSAAVGVGLIVMGSALQIVGLAN